MAVERPQITIVGCGPGGPEYVTPAAQAAVASAAVVLGPKRLLRLFPQSQSQQAALPAHVEPALRTIAEACESGRVAVLVSGDPGLFSLAKAVARRFGSGRRQVVPAVSSVQVAFARLGLDWSDARILSAHGRLPSESADQLRRSEKIAVLGGTGEAVHWVAELAQQLAASHVLFVCENLTLADETVRRMRPAELRSAELSSLSLMILVREETVPPKENTP